MSDCYCVSDKSLDFFLQTLFPKGVLVRGKIVQSADGMVLSQDIEYFVMSVKMWSTFVSESLRKSVSTECLFHSLMKVMGLTQTQLVRGNGTLHIYQLHFFVRICVLEINTRYKKL